MRKFHTRLVKTAADGAAVAPAEFLSEPNQQELQTFWNLLSQFRGDVMFIGCSPHDLKSTPRCSMKRFSRW